jgi:PrcB C-terminal
VHSGLLKMRSRSRWGWRGPTVVGLAVTLLVVGWTVTHSNDSREHLVAWRELRIIGGPFEFATLEQHRFQTEHDFAHYFRTHLVGRTLGVPPIDFSRFEVEMFTVGPRSSAGYSLSTRRVYERAGKIVVSVDEQAPRLGSPARSALTFPYILVRLPRGDEPVVLDWRQHP